MKIIFSFVSNRKANNYNKQYIEIAAFSNYLVKKQHPNIKTIFLGDKQSLNMFGNIKYDEFREIPSNCLKDIPNFLWSLGKFAAISLIDEPFLHFDLDILLFKPLKQEVFNQNIVCFHNENFSNHIMNKMQNVVNINPCDNKSILPVSYNCAIFGGNDINTIKKCTNQVLDFVKIHKKELEQINLDYHKRPTNKKLEYFDMSILAEQVWTFQLFKSLNKNIYEIVQVNDLVKSYDKMMKNTGYMHLISWNKEINKQKIKDAINKLNIKY